MPIAVHLARGTYRRDRHGPRQFAGATVAATSTPDIPPIPAELLAGLSDAGRAFLCERWAELALDNAVIDAGARMLLRLGADLTDERAATREAIAKAGTLLYSGSGRRYVNPLAKHLRAVESELIAVLKELRVEPPEVR